MAGLSGPHSESIGKGVGGVSRSIEECLPLIPLSFK